MMTSLESDYFDVQCSDDCDDIAAAAAAAAADDDDDGGGGGGDDYDGGGGDDDDDRDNDKSHRSDYFHVKCLTPSGMYTKPKHPLVGFHKFIFLIGLINQTAYVDMLIFFNLKQIQITT